MNKTETKMILSVIKAAYPHSFKDMTRKDAEAMVALWERSFAGDPYDMVNAAVAALIVTRTAGYSPTVGEVKEQIQKLSSVNELSEIEAWALVSKACANGLYGYRKEFAKLPPEVQRAVGSPEQLRDWAMMEAEVVQSVVASNFMRNYRTRLARDKELAMLPPDVRNLISNTVDRLKLGE
jgi:hypothetical protein